MAAKPRPRNIGLRYAAGLKAVRAGADPALTLSYVLWPTPHLKRATTSSDKAQTTSTKPTLTQRRNP